MDVDHGGHPDVPERQIALGVTACCLRLGAARAEFSVALLDDAAMTRLHGEHLGKPEPTDVLAFALYEPGEPVVGDVYLGYQQAARQARAEGVPLGEELVRLAIHGALHVLGEDHPDDPEEREASPMYRLQEELLREVVGGGAA